MSLVTFWDCGKNKNMDPIFDNQDILNCILKYLTPMNFHEISRTSQLFLHVYKFSMKSKEYWASYYRCHGYTIETLTNATHWVDLCKNLYSTSYTSKRLDLMSTSTSHLLFEIENNPNIQRKTIEHLIFRAIETKSDDILGILLKKFGYQIPQC